MSVPRVVFVGDELTAAGWRLAGLETRVPASGEAADCVDRVLRAGPALLLLGASVARALAPDALDELLRSIAPPVLVVGEAAAPGMPFDFAGRVRRELGVR